MSDSPPVDSLDEFPSESLDLHSSPSQQLLEAGGFFASVPASLAGDSAQPSGARYLSSRDRRRRSRLQRLISAAKGSFSGRVRIQTPDRSTLGRAGRRARIRRMITEAAGRDSLTRIATISQLAPLLARVAAASSARLSRRLRGAIQPLAVKANVFAVNLRHVPLRAGATSATRAWTAAESSARVARQLPRTVHPLGVMARSVAARLRHGSPQGLAALRLAGRMLRPRSVPAAFAMLALIIIADPDIGPTDRSAGRAMPPTTPAALSTGAIAPFVRVEMADVGAPGEETRLATPQAEVARTSVVKSTVPPVATLKDRPAPFDTRAVQTVLNRYRDAVSTLDVTAVRAVWPNADAGVLRKEFAGVLEQDIEFEACRISRVETGVTASCAGVIESGFKAGERRPHVERRRWQFTLRESGVGWHIIEVQTERD